VLHHGNGAVEALTGSGLNKEWTDRYEQSLVGVNPMFAEAKRRRPDGGQPLVSAADRLVPFSQLRQTGYYSSFYAPLGLNDSIGAALFEGPKLLGHVAVRRKSGALRYGEAEEARLRSIIDVIGAALIRSRVLRVSHARHVALDEFSARVHGGLVILDERGELLEAEGVGRQIVESRREHLVELFQQFHRDPARATGVLTLASTGAPGAAANGDELEFEFRKVLIEGRNRVLCVLGTQAAAPATDSLHVPANLHFTPRERDVLMLLSRGLDNLSIARSLGIGLYTTKDHVKAIFRKLAVKTRAEAVAVLARQPS
jgi:DNA-binding CsgD family transcriptional regulator